MKLPNVDTRRLSGLKYKLICRFKLAAYMVGGGIITNNNNNNNNRNTLIHLNVNDPPKKKILCIDIYKIFETLNLLNSLI